MPHWAELDDDDTVLRVAVTDDGDDPNTPPLYTQVAGGRWVRTYYDTPGQQFAGVGWTWEGGTTFRPPAPFPSWTFDAETAAWVPPVELPVDDHLYEWDEESGSWSQLPPTEDAMDAARLAAVEEDLAGYKEAQAALNATMVDEDSNLWDAVDGLG